MSQTFGQALEAAMWRATPECVSMLQDVTSYMREHGEKAAQDYALDLADDMRVYKLASESAKREFVEIVTTLPDVLTPASHSNKGVTNMTDNNANLTATEILSIMNIPMSNAQYNETPAVARDLLSQTARTGARLVSESDAILGKTAMPDLETFAVWRKKAARCVTEVYATAREGGEWEKKLVQFTGCRADQIRGMSQREMAFYRDTLTSWGKKVATGGLEKAKAERQSASTALATRAQGIITPDMLQMFAASSTVGMTATMTLLAGNKVAVKLEDGGKSGTLRYDVATGNSEQYKAAADYNSDKKAANNTGRLRRLAREHVMGKKEMGKFSKPDMAFITDNRAAFDVLAAGLKRERTLAVVGGTPEPVQVAPNSAVTVAPTDSAFSALDNVLNK